MNQNGAVTSEADALFIFPDLRTALVGEFNANTMVAARETRKEKRFHSLRKQCAE